MLNRPLSGLLLAIFASSLFLATDLQSQASSVEVLRVEMNDWTFVPVLSKEDRIEGFLARLAAKRAVGDNLTLLWIRREEKGWSTWAWPKEDTGNAIAYVLKELKDRGIEASILDEDLVASAEAEKVTNVVAPELLVNGLFEDDPLQEKAREAEEPDQFVEDLAQAGWAAAPEMSFLAANTAEFCPVEKVLAFDFMVTDTAQRLEEELFGASTISTSTLACIRLCWPSSTTTYGAKTFGTWGLTLGPIPSAPGTDICHYSRTWTRTCTTTSISLFCRRSTSTTTQTGTELGRAIVERGDPCPPTP